MVVAWTVKGPNWEETLNVTENIDVVEIATRALELKLKRENSSKIGFDLGIILEVWNNEMKSELEHFVVLTSSVLANAGLHFEARELENSIKNLF
jgi:hypothetical protein